MSLLPDTCGSAGGGAHAIPQNIDAAIAVLCCAAGLIALLLIPG